MVYGFGKHCLQPPFQQASKAGGHLHDVRYRLMAAAVGGTEVSALESVEKLVFIVFSYVKNEWTHTCVFVPAVLLPSCCSADGNDYAR